MKKAFKFQRCEGTSAEHCCVPHCSSSAKFNSVISFHTFPSDVQQRKKWIINIRRDNFIISYHTRVCSRHFVPEELKEPAEVGGRRRLKSGAVPVLFPWNNYSLGERRLGVWERRTRPESMETGEYYERISTNDHDYSTAPQPAFVDSVLEENERLREEIDHVRRQMEQMSLKQRFGLQRFTGSDSDIRFYTRFSSYDHLMRFWQVIEPPLRFMVRVTRTGTANVESEKQSASMVSLLSVLL
ncbi:THAP domain-containing protein 2-like [Carassius carassius]|uniref:THAP domain-containing protein 2-like n=1 Tax=Carassius carassius TaxID=217509 RepID=UPI00286951B8|nr:THAP domain-containing protein 2-like [Carassius carassius]